MKQLIVNQEHLQTRVALVEDGKIQEYYIERDDSNRIVGSIYKGRIKNMEDSLHAAFVDVGLEKNAFLHYWDMVPPDEDSIESGSFQGEKSANQQKDEGKNDNQNNNRNRSRKRRRRGGSRNRSSNRDRGNNDSQNNESNDRHKKIETTDERVEAPPRKLGIAAKLKNMFMGDAAKEQTAQNKQQRSDDNKETGDQKKGSGSNRQNRSKRNDGDGDDQSSSRNRNRSRSRSRSRNRKSSDDGDSSGSGGSRRNRKSNRSNRGRSSGGRRKRSRNVNIDEITKKYKAGHEVIVQVTKGMIADKGPRVTTNLSIPGTYVVLMPHANHRGVSKRIADRKERGRLKSILNSFDLPENMGVICRTASVGQDAKFLKFDLDMLLEKWAQAERAIANKRAPYCVYQEPALVERTIRDFLSFGIDEIVVDSDAGFQIATTCSKKLSKDVRPRIRRYNNPTPIFEHFGLNNQIQRIFRRKVVLPSGSEIAIDETQALVAIDVDTAKSKGKDHPETILNTNMEAAEEAARQLRLRNIGGLVVIDFIDMRSKKDQMKVYNKFRDCLSRDRAKTKAIHISRLGLLEMTRQREHESLQHAIFEPCYYCGGRGVVKSSISISVEIQRRLRELLRRNKGNSQIRVTVHPAVLARLKNEDAQILRTMEDEFGGDLSFRADANIHQEEFHLIDTQTGKEIF